jgi:hypothetical protein
MGATLCLLATAEVLWMLPAALLGACLPFWRYWVYLIRFARATWRLRTVAGRNIVLRYSADATSKIAEEDYLRCAEAVEEEAARRFGFPLKRRMVIFVFRNTADIPRLFHPRMGACALTGGDAVVMTPSGLGEARVDETLRHEVAHLYSAYWGKLDPPLKGEGLATWLMASVAGKSIRLAAVGQRL